jgi:small subunit ribosomal protein S6
MKQYEITIIVDPVLSGDDLKAAAKTYTDMIIANGGAIVNVEEIGLRPLAYPINKRASGTYFCIEFTLEVNGLLPKMELAMRRDDRIMRYLTIVLDKFGIKYNEDRRAGKIGSSKKEKGAKGKKGATPTAEPVAEAPATAPVVEAPAAPVVAAPAPVVEAEVDPEVVKLESVE